MNKSLALWIAVGIAGAALGVACSAGQNDGGGGSDPVGTGGAASSKASSTSETVSATTSFGEGVGGGMGNCDSSPNEDADLDGFTFMQGDCNDCDANVNPNAIEVVIDDMGMGGGGGMMEPADEDCDGMIDNEPMPCDAGLMLASTDALDAARSIELCHQATPEADWGVVAAQWVRANGVPSVVTDQWGIMPEFGPAMPARGGDQLLVMSSGKARLPNDGGCGFQSCTGTGVGTPPPGFPQDNPNCPLSSNINDDVGIELTLKAPSNATGYQFDFDFYSFEYPEWVCDFYNDQFIALVNPAPVDSLNGNISFDSMNNPVSVNIAFFDVCDGCALGTAELAGTGFDTWNDAGATGWLQTTAPIGAGETFTIRYSIWDTGDPNFDSTVLVDNFKWIANGGTVNVGTNPVPD